MLIDIIKRLSKYFVNKKNFRRFNGTSNIYVPINIISGEDKISIGDNVTILKDARLQVFKTNYNINDSLLKNDNRNVGIYIDNGVYICYRFSCLCGEKSSIRVSKNCVIGSDVLITSENHGMNPEDDKFYRDQSLIEKSVYIGDGCWIGDKVVILPGVSIGKKCIIGAGSIVTKSFDDYLIIAGNPAKAIKKYDFNCHKWVKI